MLLKKNSKLNSSYVYAIILGIILISFNLFIEISSVSIDSHLLIRSILSVFLIILINGFKNKKFLKYLLVLFITIFSLNIILNMINVYSLNENSMVQNFCQQNGSICSSLTVLFFKFKIFRFITLSSYFFTIPIFILIAASQEIPKINKEIGVNIHQKIFLLIISIMLMSNLFKAFQIVYLSFIQSYQVVEENYYDRFTFKKGGVSYYGWIRVYSNFVINNTEDNVSILVPPRELPYKMEGNINYFRWFMYPRRLYHLEDLEKLNKKADFIVISAGECENKNCVWPDFYIDESEIENITLINRETQEVTRLENSGYNPSDFNQKWGLIKLK